MPTKLQMPKNKRKLRRDNALGIFGVLELQPFHKPTFCIQKWRFRPYGFYVPIRITSLFSGFSRSYFSHLLRVFSPLLRVFSPLVRVANFSGTYFEFLRVILEFLRLIPAFYPGRNWWMLFLKSNICHIYRTTQT